MKIPITEQAATGGKYESQTILCWMHIWLIQFWIQDYGGWPASGEIDIMESRGNLNYVKDGVNIGAEQVWTQIGRANIWLKAKVTFKITIKN